MMEVFEMLLDHGSLGLFAAFLVWLYTSMQKRMDVLVEKFQDQLEKIREEQKVEILEMRKRYDEVIKNYNSEISSTRLDVAEKVKLLYDWSQNTDRKMGEIVVKLELLGDNNDEVKVMVNSGLDIMRNVQQEQKFKEIAKSLKSEG